MSKLKERKFVVTKVVTYEPVEITIYGESRRGSKAVAAMKAYNSEFKIQTINFKIK